MATSSIRYELGTKQAKRCLKGSYVAGAAGFLLANLNEALTKKSKVANDTLLIDLVVKQALEDGVAIDRLVRLKEIFGRAKYAHHHYH